MILTAFRLVHEDWIEAARSGEGSRRAGGRWNSKGYSAIYAADSLALAVLEVMVHAVSYEQLLYFRYIEITFAERMVKSISEEDLPENWRSNPPSQSIQKVGDSWLASKASPVLRVPSAVIPVGFNYVLNPDHLAFNKIEFKKPLPFQFGPRLMKGITIS